MPLVFSVTISFLIWGTTLACPTVNCGFAYGQSHAWNASFDRGGIAVRDEAGVFLSWRLLGHDQPETGFLVYRESKGEALRCLTPQPILQATSFLDRDVAADQPGSYWVVAVHRDSLPATKLPAGAFRIDYSPTTGNYLSIPTDLPDGYHANDAAVGDLDGDGNWELVVHLAGRGRDSSQAGLTDPPMFRAYRLDGSVMWTISLGKNCREGAHYNPFLVYDLDGDGIWELVCRTSDGSRDGQGKILGDAEADWRNLDPPSAAEKRRGRGNARYGKILSGPEFLTVFSGRDGAALDSIPFQPARSPEDASPPIAQQKRIWGDDYGNRMDRFLATIAYLDGEHPSIVISRGYYTRTFVNAFDFHDQKLTMRWSFDNDQLGPADSTNPWRGQGNHSISVANLDTDPADEILFGGMAIDNDGQGLYSTGLGHGDAQHTTDLDPSRPGLETWSIHENESPDRQFVGSEMRDAQTGEILFVGRRGRDVGRGMAADIDPRHPGHEMWGGSRNLFNSRGEEVGPAPRTTNMAIWWDGDPQRELLSGVRISKWDFVNHRERSLFDGTTKGLAANNGTKDNPCLVGDILGDWREELIARTADNREIRIYCSTMQTQLRTTWLMEDRQYRLGIVWQNVGYNQPAHPSSPLAQQLSQIAGDEK